MCGEKSSAQSDEASVRVISLRPSDLWIEKNAPPTLFFEAFQVIQICRLARDCQSFERWLYRGVNAMHLIYQNVSQI